MAKKQFKAESKRLLDLMINSIYTHKEIFLREIISNASDACDKLCYQALTDDSVKLTRKDFKIDLSVNKDARTITVADNGIGMDKEEIVKIAAYCPNGMDGPAALLAPRWGEPFHMAVSGLVWLDFSIATKGTGLAEMCGALGVSPEETAAFGDNWNDQAMLDMAGRCYLMEQADGALRRTLADSRAAAVREAPRSCRDVCDELEAILSCAQ